MTNLFNMTEKILVTSASGNIGKELVKILKEKDTNFIAGVHSHEDLKRMKTQDIKSIIIDFNDTESLHNAMQKIDILFLLVPFSEKMLEWGNKIIDAAKKNNVKHIVRSSCFQANSSSNYLLFKVHDKIDHSLKKANIPFTIIKPNTFMQNFVNIHADTIKNAHTFYLPQADAKTSFVDIRDIAAVAAEILINRNNYINMQFDITGPKSLNNYEVSDILSSIVGEEINYFPIEDHMAVEGMQAHGFSPWKIDALMSFHHYTKKGKLANVSSSVKDILKRNAIDFEQFARDYINSWQQTETITF